ncbi:MAG: hypothetical protein ABI923_05330 [bacterium]
MNDLALRIRLDSLITNLEQVRLMSDSLESREQETTDLHGLLEDALKMAVTLTTHSKVAGNYADDDAEVARISLKKTLETLRQLIESLQDQLDKMMKTIESMGGRFVNLKDLSFTLQSDLDDKTEDWLKTLNSTRNKLNQAPKDNGEEHLEKAWKDAIGQMYEQNQLFFSDYVDFLGGLALRDKGWDRGICQIADELIGSCGNFLKAKMWDALTLPANREAVTLARIIRMGFPEWTIWALPLAAHELGLVAVSVDNQMEDYIQEQAGNDRKLKRQVQACLADAFATCTMGPAYACATILLRFNPLTAYEEKGTAFGSETLTNVFSTVLHQTLEECGAGVSFDENLIQQMNAKWEPALRKAKLSNGRGKALGDAQRAYVILTILEQMMVKCGPGTSFDTQLITRLRTEWESALRQAKPAGCLTEQKRLDTWLSYAWTRLSEDPRGAIYCGRFWIDTKETLEKIINSHKDTVWCATPERFEQLSKGPQDVQIQLLQLNNPLELRDVINAAWACRVERLGNAKDDAQESDRINSAALKLWDCVKEKKNAQVQGGAGVGRPVVGSKGLSKPGGKK